MTTGKKVFADPEQTNDDVLTLQESARMLQVSAKTLAAHAKAGQVPHCRVGKQFRFVRAELLAWARSSQRVSDELRRDHEYREWTKARKNGPEAQRECEERLRRDFVESIMLLKNRAS